VKFVSIFAVLYPAFVFAQLPAFPGALGYGAYATGGRNGTVYHVTNLNDSGAGSFRDAVSHSARVIVFDVGGHVTLQSAVSCSGNITIAGQTAPGGICFDAGEVSFSPRANIICRYIRVRPGSQTSSVNDDAISLYQCTNVILDHVSVGFGPYDNIDAVTTHAVSIQNCIDADPIGQQFGAHVEGSDWSWQYNIFANSHNRNPLTKCDETFINNLEYNNNAGYTTHTSGQFTHDIVNNYFVTGPGAGGSSDFPWFQVDNNQSVYQPGNLLDNNNNGTLDGSPTTVYWYQGGSGGTVLAAPWSSWTSLIPTVPAPLAWRYDVSASGAFPRDDMDSLVIGQIQTIGSGTAGTGAGTAGPSSGLYTSQTQTGLANNGYGTFTGGVAPANSSGDGIADYWKLAINLDTNISYPLTNTADGYTSLEHYLNFLAGPHAVTQTNAPVLVNLSQFTAGFSSSAVFSVTNATNGTVSIVNGTNANFVPSANFNGLGSFAFTVSESGYALSTPVTICITPIAPPTSAINFNGALVTVATNSAAIVIVPPNNLTWHGDGTANVWNTSVSNWLNGTSLSLFKNTDTVTFDDTGSATPPINLTAAVFPGAIFFNNTQDYTLSGTGALGGSASLSKTGSGTLTIATTNSSFTGAIFVNGGKLALNPATSIGSGAITLSGSATLALAPNSPASTIPGNITVPAGNSATITSGYVANGGFGNFISGDTNSTLNFIGNNSFGSTSSSQFNSFFGTINIVSGNIRFSANSSGNTYGSPNPNFIINGTLQPRNAGNTIKLGALNGSGQITGPQSNGGSGNTVYNIGGNNQPGLFSGVVTSNTATPGSLICFVKVGTGTQALNGNNTFTGTNAVLAGTLLLNGTNQPSLTTVFSGATLGGTGVINSPVALNSGGKIAPGATGIGSFGTFTINNNLTNNTPEYDFDLSGNPSGSNDLINMTGTLAMTGTQTFNFNLTDNSLGAGTYSLIQGANNSTQSGVSFASNLPGNTRQNISFNVASPGSNPSYVQLLVSGNAASLVWSGTNGSSWDTSTINWLNAGNADQYYNLDAVTFDDTSTNGSVTLAGVTQPASITVNNNSLAYTFGGNGALTGSGALTKSGSSTLAIGTTNGSFTGSINLTDGALSVADGASIGTGALSISGGATFSLGNGSSFGGPIYVPAGQNGTISSAALGNTFPGNISSGNTTSVLNLDNGISFSGTNSTQLDGFSGTINISSGATIRFSGGNPHTFGSFNPVFVINGTMEPRNAGNTIRLGAFTGSGTLAGPQSNGGSGDTLYVIGGNNISATFGGIISSNSAVTNSAVIVYKTGNGTLTLSGASTYTGGTTVSAGTLCVNNLSGSATGTGDLEVFAGATLTGNGSIASSTTIDNGGTLAPGNSTGTLTIANNLTLGDSSILQFGLGTNSDSIAVGGDLALTGQLIVTNSGGFGIGTYPILTYGGALNIGNFVLASAPAGFNYRFNTNTPGVVSLVVSLTASPKFGGITSSQGNFIFSGSNGVPLGNYVVYFSTNVAESVTNWIPVLTNQFDGEGNFSFTNVPGTNLQEFYILQTE
jgi:autotransporter-associated beta strand protein